MTSSRRLVLASCAALAAVAFVAGGCRSRVPRAAERVGPAGPATTPAAATVPPPSAGPAPGADGVEPRTIERWPVPPTCEVGCRPTPLACTASNLMAPLLVAGVTAYGFANWDYGSGDFAFEDEGWFGRDAEYGGADKLGHAVAAHIFTSGLAAVHRAWGFDRPEAARRALLAAGAGLLAMEVGDGFSDEHGFSFEDLAFDAVGCAFGWLHASDPRFDAIFDLRWEHWPRGGADRNDDLDPATAYEDSAYVLAVNVGAVTGRCDLWLDVVDLQVGYRVRDLDAGPDDRRQELLLGVGLNLTNLLLRLGAGEWCHVFEVWQPPWLSLQLAVDLND